MKSKERLGRAYPFGSLASVHRDSFVCPILKKAALLRFGLIPHWSKDAKVGYRMINAKAETLQERPAYRGLLAKHRCLILADGFYEWRAGADGKKVPIRFTVGDQELFAFAGLWSRWKDHTSGETVESAAIITTTPNRLVADVHDRMPVILAKDAEAAWLSPDVAVSEALSLLQPFPADLMSMRVCSTLVNNPRNDSPELLLADGEAALTLL